MSTALLEVNHETETSNNFYKLFLTEQAKSNILDQDRSSEIFASHIGVIRKIADRRELTQALEYTKNKII